MSISLLRLVHEYGPQEAASIIINDKVYLERLCRRVRRLGWRRMLSRLEWSILYLAARVVRDRARSPLLKSSLARIVEKCLNFIVTPRDARILWHIERIREAYRRLMERLEGAMKKIYEKLISDWEYLYHKALNIISGEASGAYIRYPEGADG